MEGVQADGRASWLEWKWGWNAGGWGSKSYFEATCGATNAMEVCRSSAMGVRSLEIAGEVDGFLRAETTFPRATHHWCDTSCCALLFAMFSRRNSPAVVPRLRLGAHVDLLSARSHLAK